MNTLIFFILAIISFILARRSMKDIDYGKRALKHTKAKKIRGHIVFFKGKSAEHYK